jgi:hypothetical protein
MNFFVIIEGMNHLSAVAQSEIRGTCLLVSESCLVQGCDSISGLLATAARS